MGFRVTSLKLGVRKAITEAATEFGLTPPSTKEVMLDYIGAELPRAGQALHAGDAGRFGAGQGGPRERSSGSAARDVILAPLGTPRLIRRA